MFDETLLENTVVYRGGHYVRKKRETKHCTIKFNKKTNSIDLNFHIASKGGGTTYVLLKINEEDFPTILDKVGEAIALKKNQMNEIKEEKTALIKSQLKQRLKNLSNKTSVS